MSETSNFLIHKHITSHPHYDFYLEVGGELKSWIIPNGLPEKTKSQIVAVESGLLNQSIKELESQEMFEDSYGVGETEFWDKGSCTLETNKDIKIIIEPLGDKFIGKYLLHVPNWGRTTKKRLWTIEKIR
ncbi:MAG: DNA polymerase ligase N-terminal domain-containing protein [Thermodesulfobacteriota bacterium]